MSHGIFGGYDQSYVSLTNLVGEDYRKLAPSRFGYPGTDAPSLPNPDSQAEAFAALLDELEINETFVISTSAGGAAGIKLAIEHPQRVKGLILLSSGMPTPPPEPLRILRE